MSIDDLERELRSSLDRQAGGQYGHGADMADVFGRARRIRRRRVALGAAVAVVAVVAVAVPVGLVSTHDGGTVISPAGPVSPSPKPAGPTLGTIAMGPATALTYLDPAGTMHNGQALPEQSAGRTPVSAFAAYDGGWIVAYDTSIVRFDSSGRSVAQGKGGAIVTTSDGARIGWQIGRTVYAADANGAGDESTWTVKGSEGLIGYLDAGPVVRSGAGYVVLTGSGSRKAIDSSITPTVASSAADVVGGVTGTPAKGDQQGALADARTGAVYWKGPWSPLRFSADGTYVAAVPVADNGDPSAIAILDARTGRVVARTPDLSKQVYLGWNLAWDGDRVVFAATSTTDPRRQALFALTLTGKVTQVSRTSTQKGPNGDSSGFVLMTP